jgi:SH3-like domain-containing protein
MIRINAYGITISRYLVVAAWVWLLSSALFLIVKKKGNWYQCKDFEGDRGWVYKSLLNSSSTVITIKENCNVRSGPGSKNRILFIVDREVPLKVLKSQGRWLQIAHEDGDQGWIHASLVW